MPASPPSTAETDPATIDAADLRSAVVRARRTIDRHAAALTRLDAVLGDGDHGDNLSIGFRAAEEALAALPPDTLPAELLRAVGHCLVSAVGGASGPLYGTAFIEAGFRAASATTIDLPLAADMLEAATDGLARRGRCAVGDKTILDTLRPAATALSEAVAAGGGARGAVRATLEAGRTGMRSTRPLVARRGIALRLGPRSVGHLDPGAVSCFLILRALAGR
ncbi:MAG TPA: dihydroxyacetone kinase subunit DhaL [Verrucomicrobiae bacterium]|nr:dihydroxyacetone kinase subunit DhaL [Verrucomicrobiae bacterium]